MAALFFNETIQMKIIIRIFSTAAYLMLLVLFGCSELPVVNNNVEDIYEGIEFNMPRVIEPVFPDYSVSI